MHEAATDIFWGLLQVRLREASTLGTDHPGTIQFEVSAAAKPRRLFFVTLDRDGARGGDGLAPGPSAWVSTSQDELWALMMEENDGAGRLHVLGDDALVRALFETLAAGPGPTSALNLRAGEPS